ncbi:MAG: LuxR C-terminal-related transcriptional regulator, partial [Cupriavidus necator]
AVRAARAHPMDVALVDVHLRGMDGVRLTRTLLREKLARRVMVMAAYGRLAYAARALRAGASGFIEKSMGPAVIRQSVELILVGVVLFPDMGQNNPLPDEDCTMQRLTDRELEVLRLLALGRRQASIAEELAMSIKTVSSHKSRIMAKVGARSIVDLVDFARGCDLGLNPNGR